MRYPGLVVLVLLASCVPRTDEEAKSQDTPPAPVEVVSAVTGDISTYILSTTTIDSESKVDVYPKVSGEIVLIKAEEGDWVKKGQLLARIDPAELELAYKQAETSYAELQATLIRLEEMHRNRMTSQESYEAAKYAVKKAKISRELAELRLENTKIVAPIPGLVTQRGLRFGERVSPSNLAFSIVDMRSRVAEVHLPENVVAKIRPHLRAEILSDGYPEIIFPGRVRRISPAVDPRNGTVKVTIDLEDRKNLLKPGMFVQVRIIADTHEGVVLVPRRAAMDRDGRMAVFVIRPLEVPEEEEPAPAATPKSRGAAVGSLGLAEAAEGQPPSDSASAPPKSLKTAELVLFEAGYKNDKFLEAKSGIEEGDLLVCVGQQSLKSGTQVHVVGGRN